MSLHCLFPVFHTGYKVLPQLIEQKPIMNSEKLAFSPYALYKDSGVEWLGQVPEHWAIKRLKELAHIKTGGKDTIDSIDDGVYPFYVRSQTIERINSYSFEGEAILTAGDGVGVGKVFHHVNERFDYHQRVYKISHFKKIIGRYLFYYMKENFYKDILRLNAKATVDSLRLPMFQNFFVVCGDIEEQTAIADYLDQKTAQIDHEIDLLSKKTALYANLKQSLINETVTRGLDKNVALKDSGVEWLGQVPEHWEVKRLKDFCDVNPVTKVSQRLSKDELIEFIPMTNIDELSGTVRKFNYNTLKNIISGYTQFRNNDIIFAKITPCMENGNCAIVSGLTYNLGFGSTEFLVYRPYKNTTSEYLHYFLHNKLFRLNAEPFMKGSAGQKRISNFYISTHCFPCPPLSEQKAIADYLDQKTAQIDSMVSAIGRKIATLQELRKTLINDVVTGQIKVI